MKPGGARLSSARGNDSHRSKGSHHSQGSNRKVLSPEDIDAIAQKIENQEIDIDFELKADKLAYNEKRPSSKIKRDLI